MSDPAWLVRLGSEEFTDNTQIKVKTLVNGEWETRYLSIQDFLRNATQKADVINWNQSRWQFSDFSTVIEGDTSHSSVPFIISPIEDGQVFQATEGFTSLNNGVMVIASGETELSGALVAAQAPITATPGLCFRAVMSLANQVTGRIIFLGFHNSQTNADSANGMYFYIEDKAVTVVVVEEEDDVTYELEGDLDEEKYYVFDIVQLSESSVRFVIVELETGVVVMNVVMESGVPTADQDHSFVPALLVLNDNTTDTDVVFLDYMGFGPEQPDQINIPYTI